MKKTIAFSEETRKMVQITKALAHPVRLFVLKKLSKMNTCCYSSNLIEELPIGPSTLSQHLRVLKNADLIQGKIEAPYIKYCINRKTWEKAEKMFEQLFTTNQKQ